MGGGAGGHWLVRMEWRPAGWSVCLPLINLPLHHEVQKFSSGAGSPGWSWKKGHKMVLCVCVIQPSFLKSVQAVLGPQQRTKIGTGFSEARRLFP